MEAISVITNLNRSAVTVKAIKADEVPGFFQNILNRHKQVYGSKVTPNQIISIVNLSKTRILRMKGKVWDQLVEGDSIWLVTNHEWQEYCQNVLDQEQIFRHGKRIIAQHPSTLSHERLQHFVAQFYEDGHPVDPTRKFTSPAPPTARSPMKKVSPVKQAVVPKEQLLSRSHHHKAVADAKMIQAVRASLTPRLAVFSPPKPQYQLQQQQPQTLERPPLVPPDPFRPLYNIQYKEKTPPLRRDERSPTMRTTTDYYEHKKHFAHADLSSSSPLNQNLNDQLGSETMEQESSEPLKEEDEIYEDNESSEQEPNNNKWNSGRSNQYGQEFPDSKYTNNSNQRDYLGYRKNNNYSSDNFDEEIKEGDLDGLEEEMEGNEFDDDEEMPNYQQDKEYVEQEGYDLEQGLEEDEQSQVDEDQPDLEAKRNSNFGLPRQIEVDLRRKFQNNNKNFEMPHSFPQKKETSTIGSSSTGVVYNLDEYLEEMENDFLSSTTNASATAAAGSSFSPRDKKLSGSQETELRSPAQLKAKDLLTRENDITVRDEENKSDKNFELAVKDAFLSSSPKKEADRSPDHRRPPHSHGSKNRATMEKENFSGSKHLHGKSVPSPPDDSSVESENDNAKNVAGYNHFDDDDVFDRSDREVIEKKLIEEFDHELPLHPSPPRKVDNIPTMELGSFLEENDEEDYINFQDDLPVDHGAEDLSSPEYANEYERTAKRASRDDNDDFEAHVEANNGLQTNLRVNLEEKPEQREDDQSLALSVTPNRARGFSDEIRKYNNNQNTHNHLIESVPEGEREDDDEIRTPDKQEEQTPVESDQTDSKELSPHVHYDEENPEFLTEQQLQLQKREVKLVGKEFRRRESKILRPVSFREPPTLEVPQNKDAHGFYHTHNGLQGIPEQPQQQSHSLADHVEGSEASIYTRFQLQQDELAELRVEKAALEARLEETRYLLQMFAGNSKAKSFRYYNQNLPPMTPMSPFSAFFPDVVDELEDTIKDVSIDTHGEDHGKGSPGNKHRKLRHKESMDSHDSSLTSTPDMEPKISVPRRSIHNKMMTSHALHAPSTEYIPVVNLSEPSSSSAAAASAVAAGRFLAEQMVEPMDGNILKLEDTGPKEEHEDHQQQSTLLSELPTNNTIASANNTSGTFTTSSLPESNNTQEMGSNDEFVAPVSNYPTILTEDTLQMTPQGKSPSALAAATAASIQPSLNTRSLSNPSISTENNSNNNTTNHLQDPNISASLQKKIETLKNRRRSIVTGGAGPQSQISPPVGGLGLQFPRKEDPPAEGLLSPTASLTDEHGVFTKPRTPKYGSNNKLLENSRQSTPRIDISSLITDEKEEENPTSDISPDVAPPVMELTTKTTHPAENQAMAAEKPVPSLEQQQQQQKAKELNLQDNNKKKITLEALAAMDPSDMYQQPPPAAAPVVSNNHKNDHLPHHHHHHHTQPAVGHDYQEAVYNTSNMTGEELELLIRNANNEAIDYIDASRPEVVSPLSLNSDLIPLENTVDGRSRQRSSQASKANTERSKSRERTTNKSYAQMYANQKEKEKEQQPPTTHSARNSRNPTPSKNNNVNNNNNSNSVSSAKKKSPLPIENSNENNVKRNNNKQSPVKVPGFGEENASKMNSSQLSSQGSQRSRDNRNKSAEKHYSEETENSVPAAPLNSSHRESIEKPAERATTPVHVAQSMVSEVPKKEEISIVVEKEDVEPEEEEVEEVEPQIEDEQEEQIPEQELEEEREASQSPPPPPPPVQTREFHQVQNEKEQHPLPEPSKKSQTEANLKKQSYDNEEKLSLDELNDHFEPAVSSSSQGRKEEHKVLLDDEAIKHKIHEQLQTLHSRSRDEETNKNNKKYLEPTIYNPHVSVDSKKEELVIRPPPLTLDHDKQTTNKMQNSDVFENEGRIDHEKANEHVVNDLVTPESHLSPQFFTYHIENRVTKDDHLHGIESYVDYYYPFLIAAKYLEDNTIRGSRARKQLLASIQYTDIILWIAFQLYGTADGILVKQIK
jgi:hypothetical protein